MIYWKVAKKKEERGIQNLGSETKLLDSTIDGPKGG